MSDAAPTPETQAVCRAIEHTLLSAAASAAEIEALCEQAMALGLGAVCINPVYVAQCREQLRGSAVRVVTVVGFPLGATYARCKALEAELAVAEGADELDMVMALGAAKAGAWAAVEADARAVVAAAGERPVKLIIETGLLDDPQKQRACETALRAGIAFVKTCTGFAPGAASVHDVALLAAALGGRLGIKASGGIRSAAQARALLAAGASRLGTSASLQIVAELRQEVRAE
jgi:deoxyribose-phosphate aldolase